MKLIAPLNLSAKSKMVDLYLYPLIGFYGMVLN
jgi:hypothetical protein